MRPIGKVKQALTIAAFGGLAACADSGPPPPMAPASFDQLGCLQYRVTDSKLGAAVLYYKKADGGRTLIRAQANCPTPELVDPQFQNGCTTYLLDVNGFTSQQRFFAAHGGGVTLNKSQAVCPGLLKK